MKGKRILAAMSGGVDSSVAALLLQREGWEVIGISMDLYDFSQVRKDRAGTCCSLDDLYDARRVCDTLGIPYYVLNLREEFRREVIDPFIREYATGRTPNPCILCNEHLKFRALLRKADELGAEGIATGHYAVILREPSGRCRLFAGEDPAKDQSYFLFSLESERLARIRFPVGEMTKEQVRKVAYGAGMPVFEKKESQDICFVTDDSYARFLSRTGIEEREGHFLDREGNVLGIHKGVLRYTVGQRKGLGIAAKEPLYVVAIDAEKNEVVLGTENDTLSAGATAGRCTFVAGAPPAREFRATAKVRYRHPGVGVQVRVEGDRLEAVFDSPQRSVTPGQALVLYDGREVLGGGWIECANGSRS
ncbi:MAG: tRNA 2-thiouridine(34) synthase MnmA [Deltaproteobacteria bacterium GWC2_65_14]|nr:MAG: tRNA 2-thiouridine(34) synthase MnmA [Deltaproteobacteria bacterium GWC2_65_14]